MQLKATLDRFLRRSDAWEIMQNVVKSGDEDNMEPSQLLEENNNHHGCHDMTRGDGGTRCSAMARGDGEISMHQQDQHVITLNGRGRENGHGNDQGHASVEEDNNGEKAIGTGNTWRALFGKKEKEDDDMDLYYVEPTDKGEEVVACYPKTVYEKYLEEWRNTLVGNFLGRKPSYSFVKDSAPMIWRLKGSVDVTMMESGIFVFYFSCVEDKQKVLE